LKQIRTVNRSDFFIGMASVGVAYVAASSG
jgi:hypothetical protein